MSRNISQHRGQTHTCYTQQCCVQLATQTYLLWPTASNAVRKASQTRSTLLLSVADIADLLKERLAKFTTKTVHKLRQTSQDAYWRMMKMT